MKKRVLSLVMVLVMIFGLIPITAMAKTQDTSKIFADVSSDKWFKEYVDYAYTFGIFNGTSDKTFSPNNNITRAQFVQVLANLEGIDTSKTDVKTQFSDVKSGMWYTPAVKWASENGIVNGIGSGKFAPDANVTREQMCVMLVNYTGFKKITFKSTEKKAVFADDSKISSWAKESVYKCQIADIVNGKDGNKFDPQGTGTRAEAATIFTAFHKNYIANNTSNNAENNNEENNNEENNNSENNNSENNNTENNNEDNIKINIPSEKETYTAQKHFYTAGFTKYNYESTYQITDINSFESESWIPPYDKFNVTIRFKVNFKEGSFFTSEDPESKPTTGMTFGHSWIYLVDENGKIILGNNIWDKDYEEITSHVKKGEETEISVRFEGLDSGTYSLGFLNGAFSDYQDKWN